VTDQGIVPPGGGHLLTARGSVMAFKAVAAQTGGDFSLMERTVPPGGRRPPATEDERALMARYSMEPA
jgi:hypothetical protein